MTPRSLMGLFAAIALALPASALAAWLQISAGAQPPYYITQENFKALDAKGETRALYVEPLEKNKKLSKYSLEKQADSTYAIVLFTGQGKKRIKTVVEKGATSKPAPAPKSDKTVNNAPVVDPVAALADKSTAIPGEKKALAKQVLEKLKAGKPEEYKKLEAGGQAAVDKLLAAIAALPVAASGDAAKAYEALIAKDAGGASPLDTALGVAAVKKPEQVASEQGKPVDGDPADPNKTVTVNLINELAKILSSNQEKAAGDVTARLVKFMTGKEEGDYLDKRVRSDADAITRMTGTAKSWVADRLQKEPAAVANLYYMLGSAGPAPAWINHRHVAAALEEATTQRRPIFYEGMKPWTGAKVTGQPQRKRIAKGSSEEVHAFLTDSAKKAADVLSETRLASEVSKSILVNESVIPVPGGLGGGGAVIKDPTKGFDFNAMYGEAGGSHENVYGPDDKVARRMSIRLYTSRDASGALVNKLGVFDTTNPGDIFGQRFPLALGESTFVLDDRQPGYPKYQLKMEPTKDGNVSITFKREGGPDSGLGTITTDLNALYAKRANQAVESGNTVEVPPGSGKSYYVMGQGGKHGAALFFPSDTKSRMEAKENVVPALYAEVGERKENRNVNLPGKRTLGSVGGKDYHLAFNEELKYWEVKEGKGDDIEKPKPKDEGNATNGTVTPGDQTTTTDPDTGDVDTIGLEKTLTQSGEYERNEAVRAGLAEEYKDTVRVYDWKKPDSLIHVSARHPMIVPASVRERRSIMAPFMNAEKNDGDMNPRKDEIRGIGKWLATTSMKLTVYFDLSKPTKDGNTPYYFKQDCMIDETTKIICFEDLVLLPDAMGRGGFTTQDMEVAKTNAQKAIGEAKGYVAGKTPIRIQGGKANALTIVVGTLGTWGVWPKFTLGPAGDGTHTETKPGPTNAFDGKMPLGWDLSMPVNDQETKNADGVVVKLFHIKTEGGAALYADAAKGEEAKIKTWWLLFKVKNQDDKVMRTGFIKVLDADKELTVSSMHINGTEGRPKPATDVVSNGVLRMRRAEGKGVFYVVENKAIDVSDDSKTTNSPNCVGPVLWWGVKDEAAALEVCKKNNF